MIDAGPLHKVTVYGRYERRNAWFQGFTPLLVDRITGGLRVDLWESVIVKGEVLINRELQGSPNVPNNVQTLSVVYSFVDRDPGDSMHSPLRSLLLRPLGFVFGAAAALAAGAASRRPTRKDSGWLGEELPLPLSVRTPQDLAVKNVAERQYLIFNLLAGGKLAWDAGDWSTAASKWEALLRLPGLDPEIDRVIRPLAHEARARAGGAPVAEVPPPAATPGEPASPPATAPPRRHRRRARCASPSRSAARSPAEDRRGPVAR